MDDDRKKRLIDLGKETLAEALLELASRNNAADDLVERLIATPLENIQRFKTKLAAIKRSRRFIRWGEAAGFARELQGLLHELEFSVSDPEQGAELVAAFYETDKGTLGNCDDSSGHVGDVYRYEAKELFIGYARRCPDKERLVNLVLKLNRDDDYGVRDALIDCATDYLPKSSICTLINRLQEAADKEKDEYENRCRLHLIESLARQIGDAPLFERTRIAAWGKLSTAACVDIAGVYLETGDARTALSWLEKICADDTFQAHERDRLLLEILAQLGESQKQADVAWRMFRRHRCKDSLEALLSVIGEEQRECVISEEVKLILTNQSLSLSDAAFLVDMGRIEEAEHYLLERPEQLNGDLYGTLLPLAEAMETRARDLAATVVYRALLDSILRRGQTKTYPHGVRYLKKLDRLATSISDWRGHGAHDVYLQQLRQNHGRKSSFWTQYGK